MTTFTPPRGFEGQFLLATDDAAVRSPATSEATLHELNGVSIASFPRLRVSRVVDAAHRCIGAILGDPIDLRQGRVVAGDVVLSETLDGDIDAFVESHIYALGGRFIFVLDHEGVSRLYLDACGSFPAVYDPDTGAVASSTGLLLDAPDYQRRFRRELYEHLNVRRDGWFPGGLTAHRGIRRLLANHYLDLRSGSPTRHWPNAPVSAAADPDDACREIVRLARTSVDAMRRTGSVVATLTAGHETRLLLAACRDIAPELEFITVDHPAGRLDRERAEELAARFDLQHRRLPVVLASDEQAEEWHARSGHCVGGPNMWSHPTVDPLSTASFFTGGMGGEIGRGFFWRPTDTESTEIDASGLASRLGMPADGTVTDAVRAWLQDIRGVDAHLDTFLLLDLAYLELRMGPWAFAQPEGTSPTRHGHPLISRASFEAMLSLPHGWRGTNRMIYRSIELSWPELLELPVNRYGDWRDPARLAEKALRHPHLIAKRLRKRFG